jgi:hypothetical protein
MSGHAAKFRANERGEIILRRRRINSMRLREFSTPKSGSKDTNDIEAETIKRQQQKLAEQQLTKQRQKPVRLTTRATLPQNPQRIKPCELRTARAAGHCATQVASTLKNDAEELSLCESGAGTSARANKPLFGTSNRGLIFGHDLSL